MRPWYRQLKPQSVLCLTLPPKPVSDFIFFRAFFPAEIPEWVRIGENERISNSAEELERYSQLPYFRSWQDFAFTGAAEQDKTIAKKVRLAMRTMQTDTIHAKGIRVYFAKQATYADVVQMLDWADSAAETYFLDIHHTPVTLYAFTNAYRPPDMVNDVLYPDIAPIAFECGTDYYDRIDVKSPAPFIAQMQSWLTRWQQAWQEAFFSAAWQLPLAFLLGIMAVSSWKMARRWHTM